MFSGLLRPSTAVPAGPFRAESGTEPTFCPRCIAAGEQGRGLCPNCGEAVVPCGYCSTCEAFWNRPIAAACPKHEVELEAAPPTREPLGDPGRPTERWVTVATYGHPNEANAPRIRLEAEGVPTFLDGERVAGSTLYQVATGGVRLQVPESLASSARILLAQTWTADPGATAGGELDDEDDVWAGLAPVPGTRRRAAMKVAIILFLIGPGLITLIHSLSRVLGWGP